LRGVTAVHGCDQQNRRSVHLSRRPGQNLPIPRGRGHRAARAPAFDTEKRSLDSRDHEAYQVGLTVSNPLAQVEGRCRLRRSALTIA